MISVNQREVVEASRVGTRMRARREHENHDRPRRDAGLGMRQDHAPMGAPPGRAQILGRLDLIGIERLDRIVEREQHEQDIGVDEADHDAAEAREPADRLSR
mgnify:CR=1 FL=1